MKYSDIPTLKDLPEYWFTKVKPQLHIDNQPIAELDVDLIQPHGGLFVVPKTANLKLRPLASYVTLEFRHPTTGTSYLVKSSVVAHRELHDHSQKLGLLFVDLASRAAPTQSQTKNERVACADDMPPHAWADHPWFMRSRLKFSIKSFHRNGVTLSFHNPVRGIVESLQLRLTVAFPGVETCEVSVTLSDVELNARPGYHECTATYDAPSEKFLTAAARFLLLTVPDLTPQQLGALELPFPDLEFVAHFDFAHTKDDIKEALALRLDAYKNKPGSKLTEVTDPAVMRDTFDDHALLLTIKLANKIIGTTRLVLNDGDRTRTEIGQAVKLPDWLWNAGFVELSRSATLETLRGRDVFAALRQQALRVAYQCGFKYMLADCEAHLLDPYKRRGAQELGIEFVHPLEGKTLHVLYYDIPAIIRGEVGEPTVWPKFWKPVADFLKRYDD